MNTSSDATERHLSAADSFFKKNYSWATAPVLIGAPMRLIAGPELAVKMSLTGGIGFLGAGESKETVGPFLHESLSYFNKHVHDHLSSEDAAAATAAGLRACIDASILPVGVGFLLNGPDALPPAADPSGTPPLLQSFLDALSALSTRPAAVWLFGWPSLPILRLWTAALRQAAPRLPVWLQVGSVAEAAAVRPLGPDVLVLQGSDAGGHALRNSASLLTLIPEAVDAVYGDHAHAHAPTGADQPPRRPVLVAAGGLVDGRTAQAALVLGSAGIVLGSALLATAEARVSAGYRAAVLRARDGGRTTRKTRLFDAVRKSPEWPPGFVGRGLVNELYRQARAEVRSGLAGEGGEEEEDARSGCEEVNAYEEEGDELRQKTRDVYRRKVEEGRMPVSLMKFKQALNDELTHRTESEVTAGGASSPAGVPEYNEWLVRYVGTGVGLINSATPLELFVNALRERISK